MRVKICGITTPSDAVLAAHLGATDIGLVFWPSSPRAVGRAQAERIIDALPDGVRAVGVFVNQLDDAVSLAAQIGLHAIQLHGDESSAEYEALTIPVIKAVAVRDANALSSAEAVPGHVTVLLDAHDPVRRGGTGAVIDWSIAAAIARTRPVMLSGGLHAGNIAAAVDAVRPDAVDVSSGVESEPGRKDPAKLRALFAALSGVHEPR